MALMDSITTGKDKTKTREKTFVSSYIEPHLRKVPKLGVRVIDEGILKNTKMF